MMRNGTVYPLQPSAPLIEERDFSLLPTPAARDWKDGSSPRPHGRHSESFPIVLAGLGHPGRLLPEFHEWAMGFPIGWGALEEQATQSSHKSPSTSDDSSSPEPARD